MIPPTITMVKSICFEAIYDEVHKSLKMIPIEKN